MKQPTLEILGIGGGTGLALFGIFGSQVWPVMPTYVSYPALAIGISLIAWSVFHAILWHTSIGKFFRASSERQINAAAIYPHLPSVSASWWARIKLFFRKDPDGPFISLQMSAMDAYTRAKEKDHWWYHSANSYAKGADEKMRQEKLLSRIASFIAQKIPIYGTTDFDNKIGVIEHAGERNSRFYANATKFKFSQDDGGRVWNNLAVKMGDFQKLIPYIDNGLTGTDKIN